MHMTCSDYDVIWGDVGRIELLVGRGGTDKKRKRVKEKKRYQAERERGGLQRQTPTPSCPVSRKIAV